MLSKKIKFPIFTLSVLLFSCVITLATSLAPFNTTLYAEPSVDDNLEPYYIGIGAGMSLLKADAYSTSLKLNQESDFAYRLFAGYQIDENWSAEVFWAELGDTEVNSLATGSVVGLAEYRSFGIGGLYLHPVDESWQVFATAGIGMLNNDFQYIDAESTGDGIAYTGFGVIWNIDRTWGLRAEYDFYNTNAQFLSLNIVTRFGGKKPEHQELPKAETLGSSIALPAVAIAKNKTCEDFHVDFNGVTFAQGSIELTVKAQQTLDDLASQLLKFPQDIRFEIRAHTDDVGSELFNYPLSLTRARVVRDYLAAEGVALSRIDAYGYGEWLVKEDNSSSIGRKHNRRAELVLLGVEKYVPETARCPQFVTPTPVLSE
jgi:outer membrane protein OmpA-like peptidoglycan-associated protein